MSGLKGQISVHWISVYLFRVIFVVPQLFLSQTENAISKSSQRKTNPSMMAEGGIVDTENKTATWQEREDERKKEINKEGKNETHQKWGRTKIMLLKRLPIETNTVLRDTMLWQVWHVYWMRLDAGDLDESWRRIQACSWNDVPKNCFRSFSPCNPWWWLQVVYHLHPRE